MELHSYTASFFSTVLNERTWMEEKFMTNLVKSSSNASSSICKALVALTPAGSVAFVSNCYDAKLSDRDVVQYSGEEPALKGKYPRNSVKIDTIEYLFQASLTI